MAIPAVLRKRRCSRSLPGKEEPMSWMQKLCEAYDAGVVCDQSKEAVKLVPLGFVRKG